jgi:hypothetical protein
VLPGLLAQTNNRLRQSVFGSFSLLNTTTLLHALLHPLEDWRSATGLHFTDDYHKYRAVMPAGGALISPNTTAEN